MRSIFGVTVWKTCWQDAGVCNLHRLGYQSRRAANCDNLTSRSVRAESRLVVFYAAHRRARSCPTQILADAASCPSAAKFNSTVLISTFHRMKFSPNIAPHACMCARAPTSLCWAGSSGCLLSRDVCSSEHTHSPGVYRVHYLPIY